MEIEKHIDGLIDLMESINTESNIYLLTGSNGSGKSLIRKQLAFRLRDKLGIDNLKGLVFATSLDQRASVNPEFGALSSAMNDLDWLPSSMQTFENIEHLLSTNKGFLIIDEPELGMGEETVMALCAYLNEKLSNIQHLYGVMIITHNRYLIENLKFDVFLNTNGLKTKEEWLNRKLIPTDLTLLKKNELFTVIRDRSK